MTTDWKALCAELLYALENEGYAHWVHTPDEDELCLRARAALAQPEPKGPTDEELLEAAADSDMDRFQGERSYPDGTVINEGYWEAWDHQLLAFARAVLARWGRHTPQPIPVSERLPGPGDCDKEGRCWYGAPDRPGAVACWDLEYEPATDDTHWLPAHALPVPPQTEQLDD